LTETFTERLRSAQVAAESALCVGIDVAPAKLPEGIDRNAAGVERFIRGIIDATADLVSVYKPNLAFFEALGEDGPRLVRSTLAAIPSRVITIGDAKRGDMGNTAERYAAALFEYFGFDSITVNPYQGTDAIDPYIQDPARGAFMLCKTSNPGSTDFQDLLCQHEGEVRPLHEIVALKAVEWNTRGNVGLVVGATFPRDLGRIRELAPQLPILVPAVGAQGGDAQQAIEHGAAPDGTLAVVSVSRQVLYASAGSDWAQAARREAESLRGSLRVPAPAR
jgi:orotidine-5'-phosphate decarboxylase